MTASKGYYSIVQFCPDLSRGETVNIGVVLLVPDRGYLSARMAKDNTRVRHVFGVAGDELRQLADFKKSFANRIESESVRITTADQLQKFIDTRGNFFQLSAPRFVKVQKCNESLEKLFLDLVGAEQKRESRKSFEKTLASRFEQAGLKLFLREQIHVTLPQANRELTVPFGFQNGRFNLLQPVSFESKQEDANFRKACVHSMQGRFISETPHEELGEMRLNVIGRFAKKDDDVIPIVRETLRENDVRLVVESDIPELVDEIRRTGKRVSV